MRFDPRLAYLGLGVLCIGIAVWWQFTHTSFSGAMDDSCDEYHAAMNLVGQPGSSAAYTGHLRAAETPLELAYEESAGNVHQRRDVAAVADTLRTLGTAAEDDGKPPSASGLARIDWACSRY